MDLDNLEDLPLRVSIRLPAMITSLRQLVNLQAGSIVEFTWHMGDPVDFLVEGRRVASGQLVVIDGKFTIQISQPPASTIRVQPPSPSTQDRIDPSPAADAP